MGVIEENIRTCGVDGNVVSDKEGQRDRIQVANSTCMG